MSVRNIIDGIEHDAAAAVHEVEHLFNQAEKEFGMSLPQAFSDAIARIQALLSSHSDQSSTDAATISGLNGQVSTLQSQVNDLTNAGQAKDAQIADLTQKLSDATGQINEMENALLAIAPAA